jgi:hypothetical protein
MQEPLHRGRVGDRGAVLVVPASVAIPASAHRVAHRQPSAHVADTAVIGCPTVPGQTCTVLFSMLRGRAVASALFSNGEYANEMGDVTIDFASSPILRAVGTQRDKPFP